MDCFHTQDSLERYLDKSSMQSETDGKALQGGPEVRAVPFYFGI
jgi:hypothetical protein